MKKVVIYTTSSCPYCLRAKTLLERKHIEYEEINVEDNEELKQEMTTKAGGRKSVPQIFIADHHVGGCDDLYELDGQGKLASLLL
jgi:glutaredoxin 3